MKRIENPINPVQRIRCPLLEFRDTLLRGRQLGRKARVLRPQLDVARRFAGRLDVFRTFDLEGVAFSHGLLSPFRATRLTHLSPILADLRYVAKVNDVNKRDRVCAVLNEKICRSVSEATGGARLTAPQQLTL